MPMLNNIKDIANTLKCTILMLGISIFNNNRYFYVRNKNIS